MDFELSLVSAEVRSEIIHYSCTQAQHRLAHLNSCCRILLKKMQQLWGA